MRQQAIATAAAVPDNYRYYIGTGSRQTMWGSDKVYDDTTGGVQTVVDRVEGMLNSTADLPDSRWTNEEYTNCGLLLPGDVRPNPLVPPFEQEHRRGPRALLAAAVARAVAGVVVIREHPLHAGGGEGRTSPSKSPSGPKNSTAKRTGSVEESMNCGIPTESAASCLVASRMIAFRSFDWLRIGVVAVRLTCVAIS